MVDYQFKCPICKKYTCVYSTADDYPEVGELLKCIKCNNKFKIDCGILNYQVEAKPIKEKK